MDIRFDPLTWLFLALAVVIVLKLRSVLGRRTGSERTQGTAFDGLSAERQGQAQQRAPGGHDNVVPMPRRDREDTPQGAALTAESVEERLKGFAAAPPQVREGLKAIITADPSFAPAHFVGGARQAYELIVTAFAEGNRKALKGLLDKDVFDGFVAAIVDREARGEQVDQSFVGINKADIVGAGMREANARVTVRFVSELISSVRDRGGNVMSGDPKRIREVIDVWTFERAVATNDPNWRLVATEAAS